MTFTRNGYLVTRYRNATTNDTAWRVGDYRFTSLTAAFAWCDSRPQPGDA